MHRVRKLLLIAVLAVGVPLKGLAAASNLFCGSLHHHSEILAAHGDAFSVGSTTEPTMDAHDDAHHRHSDTGPHAHSRASDTLAHANHQPDQSTSEATLSPSAHFSDSTQCGACATCGAHAVADSPVVLVPRLVAAPRAVIPFHSSLHDAIFVYGLERPPKSLLA